MKVGEKCKSLVWTNEQGIVAARDSQNELEFFLKQNFVNLEFRCKECSLIMISTHCEIVWQRENFLSLWLGFAGVAE